METKELIENLRKWGSLKIGDIPPNNWGKPLTELLKDAADKLEELSGMAQTPIGIDEWRKDRVESGSEA